MAHQLVLSQSGKLDAAIRFASMAREQLQEDGKAVTTSLLAIDVDLSGKTCRWLLEHMYHGSIAGGLSKYPHESCQELLELLLVGEEFICRSLVQECEMRMLSSDSFFDRCLCSYCCANAARTTTPMNQADSVECIYRVSGPTCLVTADAAVDVLAVVQHVAGSCCETDYTLRVTQTPNESKNKFVFRNPMESLHEVALIVIMSDFGSVVKSEAFACQFYDAMMEATDTGAQEILLQMSLESLCDLGRFDPR